MFCESVAVKFSASTSEEDSYSKLRQAIEDTANELLPKKPKAQSGWFSQDEDKLSRLINVRNEAMTAAFVRRIRSSTMQPRTARKSVKMQQQKPKTTGFRLDTER